MFTVGVDKINIGWLAGVKGIKMAFKVLLINTRW